MSGRLLFVINDADFFLSHRLPVALAAREAGYDVHIASSSGAGAAEIMRHGLAWHGLPLSRGGTNPLREARTFLSLLGLMRALGPDLVHLVTIKPVLYGGIAARLTGTHGTIAAVSGLGHLFGGDLRSAMLRHLLRPLFRLALGGNNVRVVVQNTHDRDVLVKFAGLAPGASRLIRGSGIELGKYACYPEPSAPMRVVFASRLLRAKGIITFVEAARRLRARGSRAQFLVAGRPDPHNPDSVKEAQVERWRKEGVVEVLGQRSDIPDVFASSHIVALPSHYGEGLPKVLIEAAACGRPIVTTDHPGCRDAIVPGVTGLLVPPRDPEALAAAIEQLLGDTQKRTSMGAAARKLAEREFRIEDVVARHLAIYGELSRSLR